MTHRDWDVIIIGGALSGSATALQLLRRNPDLRVLILERSARLKRRVGESTVEVSSYFLGRVLDLTEHLHEKHLTKQGMRFWFYNDHATDLAACSETGPGYNVRLPGHQLDRAVLDEELLTRATAAGATVLRPVRVTDVTLTPGGHQRITWSEDTPPTPTSPVAAPVKAPAPATHTATARWVIDASGVAALLARKNGWHRPNTDHPTATAWSRWSGVKNWDVRELADKFPAWSRRAHGTRFNATNHLVGRGWWAWMIPLKGGDVSIGVVYDQRLVELPPGPSVGERLRTFLFQHPIARELLADATWQEGDVHFRRNLAYRSTTFAGDGFALVGDAAGFIDPFYSPGMDWIGYTTAAAAALVADSFAGNASAERIAHHNRVFGLSYDRWFRGIYRDKYFYMGDHELMTTAFLLDLGLYYLGVASQPFRYGPDALQTPCLAGPYNRFPAWLTATYNRRLAAMARARMKRGSWGRNNHGRYFGFRSYEFTPTLPLRVLVALARYLRLELTEGWRTWFRPTQAAAPSFTLADNPATATSTSSS